METRSEARMPPQSLTVQSLSRAPTPAGEEEAQRKVALVQVGDERVEFNVQACVDDVVFILERSGSVQEMLSTLDTYVRWARMEVNVAKCAMASHLIDGNNHRCTLDQELIFKGQGIPNLTTAQSPKYLGTAISARPKVRLEAATAKCAEMEMGIRLHLNEESGWDAPSVPCYSISVSSPYSSW
jgi:hypothetical protein